MVEDADMRQATVAEEVSVSLMLALEVCLLLALVEKQLG